MEHLAERLRRHVERVRQLSGAEGASAYLPSPWFGAGCPLLVHTGAAGPVAELQDLMYAQQFHRRHLESAGADVATGDLRTVASKTPGAVLLPVAAPGHLTDVHAPGTVLGRRGSDRDPVPLAGWLSLRFDDAGERGDAASHLDVTGVLGLSRALARTFVTLYAFCNDPLTGLAGRPELHGILREGLLHAATQKRPFSMLLINPDAFERINERFGLDAGDHALREIVVRMQGALRAGDPVLRYGSAMFAVSLPGTGPAHAMAVAEKVRRALSSDQYLCGRAELTFSIGVATWQEGEDEPSDPVRLIQRADVALALARKNGGGRSESWAPESGGLSAPRVDRLGGVFTGDSNKDYRNLGLLWDALTAVWSGNTAADLASRFANQLFAVLRPSFVGVYETSADGTVGAPLAVRADAETPGAAPGAALELLRDACRNGSAAYTVASERECVLGIPVKAASRVIGGVVMVGQPNRFRADASDVTFLEGFAAGMGVALDRARLAEQERDRNERERHRLAGELKELRSVLRQVKLVYQSPAVEDVVSDARRVADTDATVLISGESGTGKGMLAQTIHQVSRRRGRPFVVVDCGSIPSGLLESELFGHERGAFTGATTRNPGRIAQADGGTLLLDEVGEVPLDVQAKLLRFVEEKHFTAVGSHQLRHVDVRILAATNRDLAREVAAGRFRLDLFHRLSVVPLELPPLRDRHEDVLLLAQHFLDGFAAKYQKPVHKISPELAQRMLAYRWPGNIRELQNRLLRAVLLADSETLTPAHMPLPTELALAADPEREGLAIVEAAVRPDAATSDAVPGAPTRDPSLREALALAVLAAAGATPHLRPPLGRWLADELVLAAFDTCHGVASRAAAAVGLPDTTYARRLQRAQRDTRLATRPHYWSAVSAALLPLVRDHMAAPLGACLLDVAESWLLAEIERRCPDDSRAGAALLGTSLPTYRRRTSTLALAS